MPPQNNADPFGDHIITKAGCRAGKFALRSKTVRQLLRKGYNLVIYGASKRDMKREIKKTFPGRKPLYHTKDRMAKNYGEQAQPNVKDVPKGQHLFKGETSKGIRETVTRLTATYYLGDNILGQGLDLINPLSTPADLLELAEAIGESVCSEE